VARPLTLMLHFVILPHCAEVGGFALMRKREKIATSPNILDPKYFFAYHSVNAGGNTAIIGQCRSGAAR
jgi:hypothetical protein